MKNEKLQAVMDSLSECEKEFLLSIALNPGGKQDRIFDIDDKPLWPKLQDNGFIECVGSRKWIKTDLLKVEVNLK